MTLERALELAKEIDTLEDWPGDVEVIECIMALRQYITDLESKLPSSNPD